MTKLSDKFEPIDIIALSIITGCIISMFIKGETVFKDVLLMISGFYFGNQVGNSKNKKQ